MQWLRLRRIGAMSVDAIGPTDPDHLIEAEVERRRQDYQSAKLNLLIDDSDPFVASRDVLREDAWREAEIADT